MDWNKPASLLHIADKANQWPELHWLRDKALQELSKLKEATEEVEKKVSTDLGRLRENLTVRATKPEVE